VVACGAILASISCSPTQMPSVIAASRKRGVPKGTTFAYLAYEAIEISARRRSESKKKNTEKMKKKKKKNIVLLKRASEPAQKATMTTIAESRIA